MIENEVTALLTKTCNYFDFIKGQLESELIQIKPEDINLLNSIDRYIQTVQEDVNRWGNVKSDIHRNVLSTCIIYLKRLDHLAKEYKLVSKGSPGTI